MKEVFRSADAALVDFYRSVLADNDIHTCVLNEFTQQALVAGVVTAIWPLPLFFPTLYVLDDLEHAEAVRILRSIRDHHSAGGDWQCGVCGETVPENFSSCWNCQSSPGGESKPMPR